MRLNLSQSFDGKTAAYGTNRLGGLLDPVPEPANMTALVLGGLALAKRRKNSEL